MRDQTYIEAMWIMFLRAPGRPTAPGEVVDLGEIGATKTNRALYGLLWVLEILAIVVLILVLALPNPDYAWRQSIEWQQHPSPDLQGTS